MELFRAMKYRNRNLANTALNSYMHGRVYRLMMGTR